MKPPAHRTGSPSKTGSGPTPFSSAPASGSGPGALPGDGAAASGAGGRERRSDEHRHVLLGRIVRRGLENASGAGPVLEGRRPQSLGSQSGGVLAPRGWGSRQRESRRLGQTPERLFAASSGSGRRVGPGTGWWIGGGGLAVGVVGLALAAVFWVRGQEPAPLAYHLEARAGAPQPTLDEVIGEAAAFFSDGTVVTFRPESKARVKDLGPKGAEIELIDGRVHLRASARIGSTAKTSQRSTWRVKAGPYTLAVSGAELEAGWLPRSQMLAVRTFAGEVSIRGTGAPEEGVRLTPGQRLLARAKDRLLRFGAGPLALGSLDDGEVTHARRALFSGPGEVEAAPSAWGTPPAGLPDEHATASLGEQDGPDSPRGFGRSGSGLAAVLGGLNARCAPHLTSPAAAAVPDPGEVSLSTCRHVASGLSGKDVPAQISPEPWVQLDDRGCLHYREDARGNRIPDFSQVGYHGGARAIPDRGAVAGEVLLPQGGAADDSETIQAAIDLLSAKPPDASGLRGVVQLGAGVFALKKTLELNRSGIVLRGQGSAGDGATVLRVAAPLKVAINLGPRARRQSVGDKIPITDVYVPVGARSITLSQTAGLAVGDEIIVFRPKTQKWICAIDTDVLPSRTDGRATPPWKPKGALTFERRIVAIDGHRVILDVPLTNALEKEFTAAYITKMSFPERPREVGVEGLAVEGPPVAADRCPSSQTDFIRVHALEDGWIRDLRVRGFAGEAVSLGPSSKRITVSDVSYTVSPGRRCKGFAFKLGGQQNLILRGRTAGPNITAVITDTEVEGPNAVVDFVAVGRGHVRVRVASRWSTGILFDNVNIEDELGVPSGDFDLARGRTTHGWSAVNSVLWNSNAEKLSVDNPPTARNWILGGGVGAQALLGTGTYGEVRGPIEPRSLYRAQLQERLGAPPASLRME